MVSSPSSPSTVDPEIPALELADLWRTVSENLPDDIVAVDRQGQIRWINRALSEHRREKVIGSYCAEYVCEESKSQHLWVLDAVFRGETPQPYEVKTLDGRWWLTRAAPVFDRQGQVGAALFMTREITQRKALEATLEERQRLLERIQNTSPAINFIFDLRRGRLLYVNESAAPMLGYSAAELLAFEADVVDRIVHPEDLAATREALLSLSRATGNELTKLTIRCRTIDGGWRWMHLRSTPFDRDSGGAALTALGTAIDVTEAKETERLLQEQSELFRLMAEMSPSVVFIYDHVASRVAYINSRVSEVYGYTPEEVSAISWENPAGMIHPDDVDRVAAHVAGLADLADGEVREFEYRLTDRQGQTRWVSTHAAVFKRLPDGRLHQLLCATIDVTERHVAAEAIVEQRELLTHMIQASPAVTFIWNLKEDRAEYVGGRSEELFGHAASEFFVSGEALRDFWVHPDDQEVVARLLDRLANAVDDEVLDAEHRMKHRDGSWRWVHNRAAVFRRDERGQVTHTIGLLFDVTSRRLAEQALVQSEASLRSVMQYAPDLIVKLDRHGRISYSNRFNLVGDGCTLAETHAAAWVIPDDVAKLQGALAAVFAARSTKHMDLRVHRLDGVERTYDCRFGPIVVNDHVESAIVIARDVTEERRDAEILRARDAQLAHASRLTIGGGMLAGIAHEVNQPLYAISNFATAGLQLLRDVDGEHAETVRQWLFRIVEQAERAGGIVRCLREFVRKAPPSRERHDVTSILRESIRFVEPQFRASRVRVQVAASEQPLPAAVDRLQIEQVLVNLLQNAVEAMAESPPAERTLLAAAMRDGDEARLSIMDRGHGLTGDDSERVFDPFYTTKPEGLGLGLAISRNIVTAHGGRIWLTRNIGAGLTFHVTLPLDGDPDDGR